MFLGSCSNLQIRESSVDCLDCYSVCRVIYCKLSSRSMLDYVEVAAYAVPIFCMAYGFEKKFPGKPVMHTIITFVMAIATHWYFWQQPWGMDAISLAGPADVYESHVLHFSVAYMVADFVYLAFFCTLPFSERGMYLLHHIAATHMIAGSLMSNVDGHMLFAAMTCEVSNIFLNGRELLLLCQYAFLLLM